ncbi:hypothetical protein [Pseudomonas sp. BP01]|uniref:hypothetical protein n=1 Tax=Pseudomonas sp. BP01 TaxID=2976152 RepID=UPI001FA99403|nr:hypothetical protein [Pseudomonas sp. BP01]
MKSRTFKQAVCILATFWVLVEVYWGFSRSPIDDRWTGEVSIVNVFKPTNVDATMTMDMIDPGLIMNRRPDVDKPGARISFDGSQADGIQKLGVSAAFFENPESWKFSQGFCALKFEKHRGSGGSWINGHEDVRKVAVIDYESNTAGCFNFELGVVDFDHIEFMIVKPGQSITNRESLKNVVFVELKRDSRVSFIQRLIMRARFSSWVDKPSLIDA